MTEFLAENNPCGQNLLRIVAVGNAIIAEILRLKDYVPDVFRLETKADQLKYGDIILDFNYLRISEAHEKKIENSAELQDLDEEFRDNHLEILTRFYLAFESIHQYATDVKNFIQELSDGHFIQQTLESVLQDEEGKQLMCETLYLFGVMLLILDLYIPGIIRERLIISYYRYSAEKSHGESNIDDVCILLRSTGFSTVPNAKRVSDYPEKYFSRYNFDQNFIDMVIGRLRSDDIYNQMSVYPHPDHRSTALSNQAGMLFICLYFSPQILQNHLSQMREITDKFFSDNWVVPIYMGITVNLLDAWDHYKAAKSALNAVVENAAIKALCGKYKDKMTKLLPRTYDILEEGNLTESFLVQNITKIINLIRDCNVTLRWYFLHTSAVLEFGGSKRAKQVMDLVVAETEFKINNLFELLLNTSQLELKVKEILKELMNEKTNRWDGYKKECVDRINELSEAFSGTRPLSKIEKNENLRKWFIEISKEITNLSQENANMSGRKIIQLIQALEEVQEFHNLDSNMHIKQYLLETRKFLHNMIQVINIKEDILINIQLISDLSYAWRSIDSNYTKIMQDSIKEQPSLVIKLRATFLKLASALEIPLLRINQAHSEDLISVSQYYSNELADYIRKVVQIIPETMFGILAQIIKLQTEEIKEIPTRLEKDKLKEYAQLTERYAVAKLTYSISVFTEGILMMKKTLVGVIELDPKQLLEDGIRKELVNNLSKALHSGLTFNSKVKPSELESKLVATAKTIDGYRRSFEYIQDYLNVQGLKILQEELSRIINYNVERECNNYLRNKVQDWQSSYQNTTIPIPTHTPPVSDSTSNNFIGRLAKEMLQSTDYKATIYLDLKGAWYDRKTHQELLDGQIFTKIREAIGPAGLVGLDKLYTFMFITDLQQNIQKIQNNVTTDKMWVEMLNTLTKELETKQTIPNPVKFYSIYTTRWTKVWPQLLEWILDIGHKQILRRHIAYELKSSCKFNSKNLESSLSTFNRALLNACNAHQIDSTKPYPKAELLFELNDYLQFAGLYDPLQQIFMATKTSHYVSLFLFLFTISHIPRLHFLKNVNSLLAKKYNDHIDGVPIIFGIVTVLQQFHKQITNLYLDYMCQYVTSNLEYSLSVKKEFNDDILTTIYFLEAFVRTAKISRSVLEDKIPETILDQYEYLSSKS